jgi:membrane protein YdbS with pleckstrin-like domain
MKQYLIEIALSTIVAVVVTLFFYIVGLDKSWQDAANTFGAAFLLMFVLGLFGRYKQNKKQ